MKKTTTLSPVQRLYKLFEINKQEIASIYIYAAFNGVLALSLPLGIQAIINLLTGGQISTSWIVLVILVIIGIALTGFMQIMQLKISEDLQQKIFTRSSFEFAYRIPRMKLENLRKEYTPELVNRFFDTLTVQKGLPKILIEFSSSSLQIIFGLILLSLYHPFFILYSFLLLIIIFLIFKFTGPKGLSTSLVESKHKYEVAHWLEEVGKSMATFKLAGNSPLPMDKTDIATTNYLTSRKAHFKTLLIQYINLVTFKVLMAAGLLLIGGLLVINQQMNIGQFVASEIIIILILNSVEKLILSMETIYDVLTAVEKIGIITDLELDRDVGEEIDPTENGISIELRNVSFRYSDSNTNALNNLNFNIKEGEKICLSGYNGSGKSLLLQIIAGLYDDFTGTISFNNLPSTHIKKEYLHMLIGDSLSKEDIFKGNIIENISLGKPNIEMQDIKKICGVLGVSDFIENLPQGYKTELLPEGLNIPTSIKRRIVLARAVIAKPKLLLLEESFNQLNEKDKENFLSYILTMPTTLIAVSNDSLVAEKLDKTIVMNKGEILAIDHAAMFKNKKWYLDIFTGK